MRILLVENDASYTALLVEFLTGEGHKLAAILLEPFDLGTLSATLQLAARA